MFGRRPPLGSLAVVLFGDGTLPELLLSCLQFRIVADLEAQGRATAFHAVQLHRHIDAGGCRPCRGYRLGRLLEVNGRGAWVDGLIG